MEFKKYQVDFSEIAKKELNKMDKNWKKLFIRHAEKISQIPYLRHMKHGIPAHVEEVTKQARVVFDIENDLITILHCFKTHKDYEKWYKSFK